MNIQGLTEEAPEWPHFKIKHKSHTGLNHRQNKNAGLQGRSTLKFNHPTRTGKTVSSGSRAPRSSQGHQTEASVDELLLHCHLQKRTNRKRDDTRTAQLQQGVLIRNLTFPLLAF